MKRFTLLLATCSLFLCSANADVQYVAIGGHATVNGALTPGVTIQTTAVGGTRLPSDWPTPAPNGISGAPDPSTGLNYNFFVVFISGYGDGFTPGPAGYFTYLQPENGVWYTAVDILVTYSYPGLPPVTVSANAVRMAYEASRLAPNSDDWGIAILDVDLSLPKVSVTATDASASETGPDNATFTVSRTGPTTAALTVALSLSGTAGNGPDYQAIPNTVVIPAGASSATVVVKPVDDTSVEGSETVVLTLASNAAYTVLGSSATATIADNDVAASLPTVTVTASAPWTIELNWLPNGQFTVSRTGSTTQSLIVKVAMSGSATNGGDYVSIGQNVTIPAGKSSVQIAVDPIIDSKIEGTETAVMTLTANAAYTIGAKSTATVNILDDDLLWAFLQKLAAGW